MSRLLAALLIASSSALACTFGGVQIFVTYYHAVPWQTDDTPEIASCGPLAEAPLLEGERIIAVSRDLFFDESGHKRCGEHVIVFTKHGLIYGVIWDTMNGRFLGRVDVLYKNGERPTWGVTSGKLYCAEELGG